MVEFWKKRESGPARHASPNSDREPSPQELEKALAHLTCTHLLEHGSDAKPKDGSEKSAAIAQVLPQFWLTLARATAALVLPAGAKIRSTPEDHRSAVDQTENWLTLVLRHAPFDAQMLYAVGMVLYDLHDVVGVEDEKEKRVDRACEALREAARLAPGRFDILTDLGMLLAIKAEAAPPAEREALFLEALERYDEAARCFSPATRRFPKTGMLHPSYSRAVSSAGTLRLVLANLSSDKEERSRLLRQAYHELSESDREMPSLGPILGRAALDLAWLTDEDDARRELFEEACRQFALSVKSNQPQLAEIFAQWGCATVGCVTLAKSGKDSRQLIERAADLFKKGSREAKGGAMVELIAARAWRRLGAHSTGEEEQVAASRLAAEAARRASRKDPGSGDYDLACALSRLKQPEEASSALLAALDRAPEAASEALDEPDLHFLWEARPELRQTVAKRSD